MKSKFILLAFLTIASLKVFAISPSLKIVNSTSCPITFMAILSPDDVAPYTCSISNIAGYYTVQPNTTIVINSYNDLILVGYPPSTYYFWGAFISFYSSSCTPVSTKIGAPCINAPQTVYGYIRNTISPCTQCGYLKATWVYIDPVTGGALWQPILTFSYA